MKGGNASPPALDSEPLWLSRDLQKMVVPHEEKFAKIRSNKTRFGRHRIWRVTNLSARHQHLKQRMASGSLSSVVSSLVRASMGASVAPTVTDEDLDRHVADLILKEAKQKAEKYNQAGIRAFLRSNL